MTHLFSQGRIRESTPLEHKQEAYYRHTQGALVCSCGLAVTFSNYSPNCEAQAEELLARLHLQRWPHTVAQPSTGEEAFCAGPGKCAACTMELDQAYMQTTAGLSSHPHVRAAFEEGAYWAVQRRAWVEQLLAEVMRTVNLLPSVTGLVPVRSAQDLPRAIRNLQQEYKDAARRRNGVREEGV